LRAGLDHAEHGVGDAADDAGGVFKAGDEAREDVAYARQDHQAVGKGDEAIVARVGDDLPVLLQVVLGRGDGQTEAQDGLAHHGALRAVVLARLAAEFVVAAHFLAARVAAPVAFEDPATKVAGEAAREETAAKAAGAVVAARMAHPRLPFFSKFLGVTLVVRVGFPTLLFRGGS